MIDKLTLRLICIDLLRRPLKPGLRFSSLVSCKKELKWRVVSLIYTCLHHCLDFITKLKMLLYVREIVSLLSMRKYLGVTSLLTHNHELLVDPLPFAQLLLYFFSWQEVKIIKLKGIVSHFEKQDVCLLNLLFYRMLCA